MTQGMTAQDLALDLGMLQPDDVRTVIADHLGLDLHDEVIPAAVCVEIRDVLDPVGERTAPAPLYWGPGHPRSSGDRAVDNEARGDDGDAGGRGEALYCWCFSWYFLSHRRAFACGMPVCASITRQGISRARNAEMRRPRVSMRVAGCPTARALSISSVNGTSGIGSSGSCSEGSVGMITEPSGSSTGEVGSHACHYDTSDRHAVSLDA